MIVGTKGGHIAFYNVLKKYKLIDKRQIHQETKVLILRFRTPRKIALQVETLAIIFRITNSHKGTLSRIMHSLRTSLLVLAKVNSVISRAPQTIRSTRNNKLNLVASSNNKQQASNQCNKPRDFSQRKPSSVLVNSVNKIVIHFRNLLRLLVTLKVHRPNSNQLRSLSKDQIRIK